MAESMRQCVVCRTQQPKGDLLRVAREENGPVVVDLESSVQGRGVYLCADAKCLTKARKSDVLSKTFKSKVSDDVYLELATIVGKGQDQAPEKLLGLALKARQAVYGRTAVESGLKKGKIRLVLLDPSIADGSAEAVEQIANAVHRRCVRWPEAGGLEWVVGKKNCRMVGVTDIAFAHALYKHLAPKKV